MLGELACSLMTFACQNLGDLHKEDVETLMKAQKIVHDAFQEAIHG